MNNDKIALNHNFKSKYKVYNMKKELDIMINKYKQKKVNIKDSNSPSLENIHICECAVIKIMKKYKQLEKYSIYKNLEEQNNRFKIYQKLFDKTLASLIKKEYIRQSGNYYVYIP